MPTPTMPKRMRSLGATSCGPNDAASSGIAAPIKADPATPALLRRNSRREKLLATSPPAGRNLLLKSLQGDFFKEHDVVVAVVLQTEVAFIRPRPALGLVTEFPVG